MIFIALIGQLNKLNDNLNTKPIPFVEINILLPSHKTYKERSLCSKCLCGISFISYQATKLTKKNLCVLSAFVGLVLSPTKPQSSQRKIFVLLVPLWD